MKGKIEEVKNTYREYEKMLLKSGRMPLWDTGIGFFSPAVMDDCLKLFEKINLSKYNHFVDLGSGDGRITALASLFTKATGIEADSYLHSVAEHMKKNLRLTNAEFVNKNFNSHNISKHDIVFVNPDRPFHRGLETKMYNELRGHALVYSNHFHPQFMKKVADFPEHSAALYSIL